ncbi:MAG TPA: Gfo/Idh/MocA family oxidoreductase [Terrimicrobiaceae bacterium]|nr:Gfo/Idh/MocA family oxidoreductase [Terrimicrobiaceae bacterium]
MTPGNCPPVKYGIVGASGIAQRRVMPAFRRCRHSVLEAICSRSEDRAQALALQFGARSASTDLSTLLASVDAVYVASPVHCHFDDARRVIEAGKHLLIEKPLARNPAEARKILELRDRHGVFAMEAYMMKFHPAHAAIREAVQAGDIGHVIQARARLGCWYPDIAGAWRQESKFSGGGALMDLGSHLISLLRWILGPIRSVRALCNTQVFSYGVEDSATLLVGFASGAHGIVEAYFSLPDKIGTGVLELTGTRGRILAVDTIGQQGAGSVRWETIPGQSGYDARQEASPDPGEPRASDFPAHDLYAAQLESFSECLITQTAPTMNTLEEGIDTLKWIERAYQDSAA